MSKIYHTGFLAKDRERPHRPAVGECKCSLCARAVEVAAIADAMWRSFRRGEVVLVQRRLGPFEYEYIAKPITSEPTTRAA